MRSAGPFCFRRYAMKPMPKKPRIIMAQVEGSGTAPTPVVTFAVMWSVLSPLF